MYRTKTKKHKIELLLLLLLILLLLFFYRKFTPKMNLNWFIQKVLERSTRNLTPCITKALVKLG